MCEGLPAEEEGTAETRCNELAAASFPSPPELPGEWTEKIESEIEPGKSEGEGVYDLVLFF